MTSEDSLLYSSQVRIRVMVKPWMILNLFFRVIFIITLLIFVCFSGCSSSDPHSGSETPALESPCAPSTLSVVTGATGRANVFLIDPISSSGNMTLSPASVQLDSYVDSVVLSHLSGQGVLSGKYVNVVNNKQCSANFGAYDTKNLFSYSHLNWRFQEAMAYYFGDIYRSGLDQIGYLQPKEPVTLVAHCMDQDNAYFQRDIQGGQVFEFVCLGDSTTTPGASYADDGIVAVHELEHATTMDLYSPMVDLNQFSFDEAGAINEAISDFVGLAFSDQEVSPVFSLDPRIFSRWALGTFDPNSSHLRGAHLCPAYDSHFPTCDRYPAFELPSSSNGNSTTISYVYPDGLGWPFPNNYNSVQPALQAFETFKAQEEIHNNDLIWVGALWDIYQAMIKNHSGQKAVASALTNQLVLESIKHLPLPNLVSNHSPVTMIGLAATLVQYAGQMPQLTSSDQASIEEALKRRGLYQYAELDESTWMEVGPGVNSQLSVSVTPGVYVLDDPQKLRTWLSNQNKSSAIVTQSLSTGLNSKLDPGEVAALWFDIQNNSSVTAGGVLVTVTSTDSDVRILDDSINGGYMTLAGLNQTQVMYAKINGTDVVSWLDPLGVSNRIPLGNTYFSTDPFFNKNYRTAIWVKVDPHASHGKIVHFRVQANPSNGLTAVQSFSVTIN